MYGSIASNPLYVVSLSNELELKNDSNYSKIFKWQKLRKLRPPATANSTI